MKKIVYLFVFLSITVFAQKKELSLDDAVLGYYKGLYPQTLRNLQWVKNENTFLYQKNDEIIFKNIKNEVQKRIKKEDFLIIFPKRKNLPYIETVTTDFIKFSEPNKIILYNYNHQSYKTISLPPDAQNLDFCIKNKKVAYTLNNNLYLADFKNKKIPVAVFNNSNIVSGQAIARSEFGITKGTFWSPKGNKLAFYQKDETNVENYPLVDVSVTPAKLNNIKYPMNGRASEEPAIGIYDLSTKKTIYLKLFDKAGKEHYVTNLSWGPDEKYIYVAEINREQNHMWMNKYDAKTGKFVQTLFEETNNKWVEPEHPAYFIPNHNNEFIWMSERDGFMNLYKYQTNGTLIKKLTDNKWVTNEILCFSHKGKYVYITGTGNDPRDKKLFKVNTKTGKIKELTSSTGYHQILLSDNGRYFIDKFSNIDTPTITLLYNYKAKLIDTLLKSPNPLKQFKINPKPEMFSIIGEFDDKLYARIFKPSNFDPNKKYPVLVYVYGGPHAQLVTNRWLGGAPLWMPWMAEQGYIVFTVDGHGSANRGFEFESVIHRRLGQVEMKDQIHGIKFLEKLPYVDSERIAVHGWSYGGFMTISLMTNYPDIFQTGVAGGPVTDWKWYEVMYGERYMDRYFENEEGFKNTSLLRKINNLKGKLLTIHGYQDDVVVPQHNIALHKEAIRNNIQMDFYLYPAAKHNVYGKDRVHLIKKILQYIIVNNQ